MARAFPFATANEKQALEEIAKEAARFPSIARIVAFGSRVRGDFKGDSDLDLLVLVKTILAKDEVIKFLYQIENDFDVPLAPVIYTVHEYEKNQGLRSPFIQNVEIEGVRLYDAEPTGKE